MKSGQLWNTIRGRGWMGGWVVEYLENVRENCLKVMKFLSRMFEIFDVRFKTVCLFRVNMVIWAWVQYGHGIWWYVGTKDGGN